MFQQATPSDSGNYTCAPANYRQHSVIVNVIKGEDYNNIWTLFEQPFLSIAISKMLICILKKG